MNDVPLIQKADINSINTSIIAIKKQLKQLTEAVGLIDVPDIPDLSPFVKKTDVVDVVEADNMNPVTSNAVAEVVPVGTIIAQYKKTSITGYLYLDGRDTTGTADELQTVYPALYAYLGNSNVLPDYREFALVGAEQNTTSSNIATHDTYTQGQEKDDQLQNHYHSFNGGWGSGNKGSAWLRTDQNNPSNQWYAVANVTNGRKGDVTRGKRKAVYFYMKAK